MDNSVYIAMGTILFLLFGLSILGVRRKDSCQKLQFIVSPSTVNIGEPVSFYDSTGGARKWYWDFGDGDTSNLQSPEHIYHEPGTFIMRLTINEDCTEERVVKVEEENTLSFPNITIEAPSSALVQQPVQFDTKGEDIVSIGIKDEKFRDLLQNRGHYSIFQSHICSNNKVRVIINENEEMDFYDYYQHLEIKRDIIVQRVRLTRNARGCITVIKVKQRQP